MEPAVEPKNESVLCGVTLAQYAAVQAALAAELPLDAVLEREGVLPAAWEAADGAWSMLLAGDLEKDGALQEAFETRFIDAQERYGRRVSPLDDDLSAWLGFVRRWSCDPEPLALLARLNMQSSDMIRLHRAWSSRLARDPALRRRAQELLQAEPPAMVAVHVQPAALSPLPPPAERSPSDEQQALPEPLHGSSDRERAPALFVALPHEEVEQAMTVDGLPKEALEEDAEPSPGPPAPRAPLVPSFALPGPSGTVPLPAFAPGPALPFTAGASALEAVAHVRAAAPEFRTDTIPNFGPPPPARLALGPLSEVGLSATSPSAPSTRELPPPPFDSALNGRRKGISLEQYAALCALVAVFPEAAESAFARCGLVLAQKRASTDLRWQSRLRRNPLESEEWARFYRHYHARFSEEARARLRTDQVTP